MQRTFRPARHNLTTAIWLGLLFGSAFIGCLIASVLDSERPFAWLGMAAFWLMWLLLVGYEVVAYYRARLEVDGQRLVKQGVFFSRELLLDDAAHLVWRCGGEGSLVVSSQTTRITIAFHNFSFDSDDFVPLVEHLRQTLPEAHQTGWDLFCLRCALPLVEPINEDCIVRTTRRDIDRLFAWMLVPNLCVTALLIWMDGWKYWPSMFVLVPLWLTMRFFVPTKGMRGTPVSKQPGVIWWLVCFVGIIAGLVVAGWSRSLAVAIWIVASLAFVKFFSYVNAENRRRQELWNEQAKTADARWRVALAEYKLSAP